MYITCSKLSRVLIRRRNKARREACRCGRKGGASVNCGPFREKLQKLNERAIEERRPSLSLDKWGMEPTECNKEAASTVRSLSIIGTVSTALSKLNFQITVACCANFFFTKYCKVNQQETIRCSTKGFCSLRTIRGHLVVEGIRSRAEVIRGGGA